MNALSLFNDRNRLWSIPLLAGTAGAAFFALRGGDGPLMRCVFETVVAAAIGFVLTAAWTLAQDLFARLPFAPSRIRQQEQLDTQQHLLTGVQQELRGLEYGLQEYLTAKKAEGQALNDRILDIENDITLLKDDDPAEELREQLSLIADKFGELAGVRAAVGQLSGKVKFIEDVARQVQETQTSIAEAEKGSEWFSAIESQMAALREDLRRDLLADAQGGDMVASLRDKFEAQVSDGVREMLAGMDVAKVAELVSVAQDERYANLERRMIKMSKGMEALQARLEELRFSAGEDSGIASVYKMVQGISGEDANGGVKKGCLAKLFQANMELRKAAA